jgi:hypothetical protein
MVNGIAEDVWKQAWVVSDPDPIVSSLSFAPIFSLVLRNHLPRQPPHQPSGYPIHPERHEADQQTSKDVEEHNPSLLAKAKLQIDPATWCSEKELKDFVEATQNANFAYRDKKSGTPSSLLTTFIKAAHKSFGVLDLFFQQQPFEASVAWGIVRFIFQV